MVTQISTQRVTSDGTIAQACGAARAVPRDGLRGLAENWRSDLVSGFIVFLIALPLSLGIAVASGAPPMAGLISAIIGGVMVSIIGGSSISVNGPAAGLIVVVLASVERFGGGLPGYRATLAAIVVAGIALVIAGRLGAGRLASFFPATVAHGMLAAIGIIIMSKQLPYMLGVAPHWKEPLELIAAIPDIVAHANPVVALIGTVSLVLLIVHSRTHFKRLKRIPGPIIVVAVAAYLGGLFALDRAHDYSLFGARYHVDPLQSLIFLPGNLEDGFISPDFSLWRTYPFWLSVISIMFVQGVESLLSLSAISRLDPFRRKPDSSRDIAAVGLASILAGMVGGLPVITEIVRSGANIASGARTRFSNFFHGLFILLSLVLASGLLSKIPLSALAALLLFTGYRLAAPRVFKEIDALGRDQTIVFVTTVILVLATDLLVGVLAGIAIKLVLHVKRGANLLDLFMTNVAVAAHGDGSVDIGVGGVLAFSNYLKLNGKLESLPSGREVRLDLSHARLVDHTVMERLSRFAEDYEKDGGRFSVIGVSGHVRASDHPLAAHWLDGQTVTCRPV